MRLYVELHCGGDPGGAQDPVQLLSGFPRRAFSEADMERPLQELGMDWECDSLERRLLVYRPGFGEQKASAFVFQACFLQLILRTCAFCCTHRGQEMSQLKSLFPAILFDLRLH